MLYQRGARVYQFGDFELSEADAELRTKDRRIPLQEKPLLLLLALVENPRHIVTREQLRQRMWDSDTFVDYEQGINVAIKKVRDALGDLPQKPKFIETVAKRGYRFLVPVEVGGMVVDPPKFSTTPALEVDPPNHRARNIGLAAISAVLAVVLSAIGFWVFRMRAQRPRAIQIRSLAVLPLQNLSADAGQEYFADGITEELITSLAQSLPQRVISRTSVMRYRQTTETVAQIARELGVDAIVEGAVTRSGTRVVLTVQLIDASEDRHLWAQTYDREVGDLISLEVELSHEIAGHIGNTLGTHWMVKTASRSVDAQVYELCLLGRYHWNKRTAASLAKALEYYRQAIARDASYAPAYAGLANVYALLPSYDGVELRDTYGEAAVAARHAIALDDTLADAHATLGLIGLNYGPWNPVEVERELRRALELNANYAPAHHWYAFYLRFVGRSEEALGEIERARELDPLSAIIDGDEGFFLYGAHHFEEARSRLRQAMELAPDFGPPHATLALIEWESGHPTDALNEAHAALRLDANDPSLMAEAGYVLAMTGHAEEARKLLARVQSLVRGGSASPRYAASIELGLGQREQALGSLEEMAKLNFGAAVPGLVQWHYFDQLKTNPRFQELMAQAPTAKFAP